MKKYQLLLLICLGFITACSESAQDKSLNYSDDEKQNNVVEEDEIKNPKETGQFSNPSPETADEESDDLMGASTQKNQEQIAQQAISQLPNLAINNKLIFGGNNSLMANVESKTAQDCYSSLPTHINFNLSQQQMEMSADYKASSMAFRTENSTVSWSSKIQFSGNYNKPSGPYDVPHDDIYHIQDRLSCEAAFIPIDGTSRDTIVMRSDREYPKATFTRYNTSPDHMYAQMVVECTVETVRVNHDARWNDYSERHMTTNQCHHTYFLVESKYGYPYEIPK